MAKVRSSRGVTVDFDLLKVKSSIENREKPSGVDMREQYINIRRRRNPRRNVSDLVKDQRKNAEDARQKILISEQNAEKANKPVKTDTPAAKAEVTEVTEVTEAPVAAMEESTPAATTPAKRKIVKRTKE